MENMDQRLENIINAGFPYRIVHKNLLDSGYLVPGQFLFDRTKICAEVIIVSSETKKDDVHAILQDIASGTGWIKFAEMLSGRIPEQRQEIYYNLSAAHVKALQSTGATLKKYGETDSKDHYSVKSPVQLRAIYDHSTNITHCFIVPIK